MNHVSGNVTDQGLQDLGLPIAVQTFLWRQIAPFTRPKLGKLHEASCMFCQHGPGHHELKEACKSFEKVIVQNIHFGLSPSLAGALQSVPRWRFVQAALPHVMHCAATLLHSRVKDLQSLGTAETKLLYTLHWMLLDAAEECTDTDAETEHHRALGTYRFLFSIPTVTLFIYLFAPIAHHLKESDFQNFRLENGLKLWQGLWEYRAPLATCFNAPCKQITKCFTVANVRQSTKNSSKGSAESGHVESSSSTSVSDPAGTPKQDEECSRVSSPKDCVFPETIPEEASMTEEERVVIFRLPAVPTLGDTAIYTADASLFQVSPGPSSSQAEHARHKGSSSSEKDSLESAQNKSTARTPHDVDITRATFLDVAVLRCLFIANWQEEGIYWALHYLYNRLRDIHEETISLYALRRRSNSLPIPQIEVSFYKSPHESPSPLHKSISPDIKSSARLVRSCSVNKCSVKMSADMLDAKQLFKSECELENIDFNKPLHFEHTTYYSEQISKPLSKYYSPKLSKGKSMPSLRFIGDLQNAVRGIPLSEIVHIPKNPIITVTEHTPLPSPDLLQQQQSLMESQLDSYQEGATPTSSNAMARSLTDTHIAYQITDETEAPGSGSFIARNGTLDLQVALQALFAVSLRDSTCCTLRVLEATLNLCELLMDLGVLKYGVTAHQLVMGIFEKSLRHLGCHHGCGEGLRGPPADFLRTQCHTILSRVLRAAPSLSRQYLRALVIKQPLAHVLDFLHSFVGFCVDPSSLLSPLNRKRSSSKSPDFSAQGGYSTNFGNGITRNAESQVIGAIFKKIVTRFYQMSKEIKMQDNLALYCDVRQFITYVKAAHGGTFRRVVLSGLLGSSLRPNHEDTAVQVTRVIRHLHNIDSYSIEERPNKKLFFKKGSTPSTYGSLLETDLDDEGYQTIQGAAGNVRRKQRPVLTPRHSEKTLLDDISTPGGKRRVRERFTGLVSWLVTRQQDIRARRRVGSNGDSGGGGSGSGGGGSGGGGVANDTQFTVMRRAGDGLGRSLQRARRRVERRLGRLGLGKGKKKVTSIEHVLGNYLSRRDSLELSERRRESEVVVLRERRLVQIEPVRAGADRLALLLELCPPGSVPDPQLLSALLDLPQAPVVARAALLVECAYFVHCCNHGQWPPWMKQAAPAFHGRQSTAAAAPAHARTNAHASGLRRAHVLQRAAGKMFHQWGEALGARLEELVNADKENNALMNASFAEGDSQKYHMQRDDEEDFLDEASVNKSGSECPPALRLMACMLLLEITAFLRETYQNLPKQSKLAAKERTAPWERVYRVMNLFVNREANRRWSMALSSMGHSQASAQSLQSIAGPDLGTNQNERKISFVLHEPEESDGSSTTALTVQGAGEDGAAQTATTAQQRAMRTVQAVRPFLLRRGTGAPTGGSFKRRSLKLRRPQKENKEIEPDYSLKHNDSIRSKRKVSSISDRSDTSEQGGASAGEESPGILSDEQAPESPSDNNDADEIVKNLPWMRSVLEVLNSFNYYCDHQGYCHTFCYRRHMRAARRLVKAVRRIYGEEFGVKIGYFGLISEQLKMDLGSRRERNRGRKVSDQTVVSGHISPSSRKDSVHKSGSGLLYDNPKLANLCLPFNPSIKPKTYPSVVKYIKSQIRELFHAPISTLIKGAAVIGEDSFIESLPIAWELLLEYNQETAAAAAALFILGAVRAPSTASDIMQKALKNRDPAVRISGVLRFQVLWKLRYQVWPRMEEGAHLSFKVPPPGIEFTLPSPKIGIESLPVVDPPWSPRAKTKDMEVTLNQERHRSLVTATKTRKKQQTEAIRHALMQQEAKRRAERQSFLLTTIPITVQAAHEPGLDHAPSDEHAESQGDDETDGLRPAAPHLHSAHSLFPSGLCAAVVLIVDLLDDAAVSQEGAAVYDAAYQVIWNCLVEDSALFLRYVLERLTRDKQETMFKLLRHLIRFVPRLPQQAAFALYNYIIGYVMFYVRSPHEGGQQLVGTALSILWMVVHSVHGIMFKDLKQILRKEQCDASILLTANVPSAKKIIVHGPQDRDEGGIPSQFPVQEDTQFCQILRESLDFFGIEENQQREHFLVDYKTHQIHNPLGYVRDFYFFKRSQYPQLGLVRMKPQEAFSALQRQELLKKFVEIGKVHLTWAILKNVDMVVQRVVFLHEELMKLPSFPRKALEADLDLYKGGEIGKELLGLDVLHKFMWVRLIARMFEAMAGNFAYSGDIQLFLNVLNGAAVLHTEDSCILRYVMATYVNAAFNFKNIFSTNGYLLIMPTLLQIYSHHQTNKLVTTTVEYAVKQFYLMNRKPFILQMFGSVSAILDTDDESTYGDAHKVQASCLFNLLLSLETPSPDPLNISELVKESKPLRAIDFCYHDENEMVTVLDCISLCVMVVSYSAESIRGYQMLIILEAILPCYVKQIQLPTYYREGKSERDIILQLAIVIKTLVNNCEGLSKSYNGPYRNSPEHKGSSQRNCSKGPPCSPGLDFEDESHSKYVSDVGRNKGVAESGAEDSELVRAEYRRPRDVLLSLVGEFLSRCCLRLTELSRKQGVTDSKPIDLLDARSHVRLADIAHSLLKVSPYDPESMACRGLQRYVTSILPRADWLDDTMRPALTTILRRLDKVFLKISKKPSIRRNTDWEAAAGLLKGVHETLQRFPYALHWQHVRALLNTCQSLIASEPGSHEAASSAGAAVVSQAPPAHFCSTVVRLISLQVVSAGDCYIMEQICGGSTEFSSQEKAEVSLMNLIIPLCLRVGSGRGDVAELHQNDISYLVTVVLNAMSPPGSSAGNQTIRGVVDARAGSLTFTGSRETKRPARVRGTLYQAAFLALRVLCVCFEQRLSKEWSRIARVMRDLGRRNEAAPELWSFLEFVVTHRTPLYIVLQPFLLHKISQPPIGDHERHMQFLIRERMRGTPPSASPRSRGALLLDLARELRELKDELEEHKYQHAATESNRRATEVYISYPHSCDGGRYQRPSLISLLTGLEQKSANCVPGDNASHSTPITKVNESTSPHSPSHPSSPVLDPAREHNKSRLQRSKAQSRKTLRFRRGKPNHNEVKTNENEAEPVTNHGEQSWETASQTSSASHCKEKHAQVTQSNDESLSPRAESQQSLLMVFETQDEDTLI